MLRVLRLVRRVLRLRLVVSTVCPRLFYLLAGLFLLVSMIHGAQAQTVADMVTTGASPRR